MKKILVLMLALVMVFAVCSLTACGEKTYTGEVTYTAWGTPYGAKVDVTVKGDKVTAVKLYTDEESGYVRTSPSWEGFATTEAAYEEFVNKFVGMTVADVLAIEATATAEGQTVTTEGWSITGATQSAARIIVAVQNALANA